MRLPVRLYALLIIVLAAMLMLADLTTVGDWPHEWTPFSALILLTLYVVAVHSLLTVHRGKMGVKALVEFALGLLGSTLAVVLMAAPGLAPALVLPGVLVYLAKQTMDRGERRSRNMALMSRVGRAVAGTLRPEVAFKAIAAREVRDTLKLDGIALVALGAAPTFIGHHAGDVDQPGLRQEA